MASTVVQIGDSHFEPRERVRYTRDQLLELREVIVILHIELVFGFGICFECLIGHAICGFDEKVPIMWLGICENGRNSC